MPLSTVKRVILYRFDRQPVEAIINPSAYLLEDRVEWITLDGKLQCAGYTECKALCFISETGPPDLFSDHNLFERRPKSPGLWTRFTFRDGEMLDGILSHNLLDWPPAGYLITPPRSGAARQRVFLPRAALIGTELRGVVGTTRGKTTIRGKRKGAPESEQQLSMFQP